MNWFYYETKPGASKMFNEVSWGRNKVVYNVTKTIADSSYWMAAHLLSFYVCSTGSYVISTVNYYIIATGTKTAKIGKRAYLVKIALPKVVKQWIAEGKIPLFESCQLFNLNDLQLKQSTSFPGVKPDYNQDGDTIKVWAANLVPACGAPTSSVRRVTTS